MEAWERLRTIHVRVPRFDALFTTKPSNVIHVEHCSSSFSVTDIPQLVAIFEALELDELDEDWGSDGGYPQVQALHALVRLASKLKAQNEPDPEALAERVVNRILATHYDAVPPADSMLFNPMRSLLIELGTASLAPVYEAVEQQAHDALTMVEDLRAQVDTLIQATVDIAVDTGNLAVARDVGEWLISFLDTCLQQWMEYEERERAELGLFITHCAQAAIPLGPAVRTERAIEVMRAVALGPHYATCIATGQSFFDWLSFMGAIGLEVHPADPVLFPGMGALSQVDRAAAVWRARRGLTDTTHKPLGHCGPWPGTPAYELVPPEKCTWKPLFSCAAGRERCISLRAEAAESAAQLMQQWDEEHIRSDSAAEEIAAERDSVLSSLMESERQRWFSTTALGSSRSLIRCCSKCAGMLYCSRDCQALVFTDKSAADLAASYVGSGAQEMALPVDPSLYARLEHETAGIRRLARPKDMSVARQHKFQCRLLRALWDEVAAEEG